MKITLTACQQKVEDKFKEFLFNDEKELVIEGSAGTGKTQLLVHLCNLYKNMHRTVKLINPNHRILDLVVTATTNKAVEVLRGNGLFADTVHATFGISVYNNNNNRLQFKRNSLIIIDEFSFLSCEIRHKILGNICSNSKIIYVGDPYQLSPVNALSDIDTITNRVSLNTIVRNSINTPNILKLKDSVIKSKLPQLDLNSSLVYLDTKEYESKIVDCFKDQGSISKIVSGRNATVEKYNKGLLNHFTGKTNLREKDYAILNIYNNYYNIKNNTSIFVDKFIDTTSVNGVTVDRYSLLVSNSPSNYLVISNYAEYKKALAKASQETINKVYSKFLDLRAEYSCTIHKSQGSTYDYAFLDLDDLRNYRLEEKLRLLYVALTRASKTTYITGNTYGII